MDEVEELSTRVRELRALLGLSQEQLAHRLAVSFATVNRWERGRCRMSAGTRLRFEALEAGEPPSVATTRGHLPSYSTTFVGRRREVADLLSQLATNRLVTVVAVGGAGKTRLATVVAAYLPDVDDVVFVSLDGISEPSLVTSAMVAAVGRPASGGGDVVDLIVAAVGQASTVLVIDAAELVLTAVADLVRPLLERCPRLRVLVTSRAPLGIAAERIWPLPLLDCTAPESGLLSDASRLFLARARTLRPGLDVTSDVAAEINELCRDLDGLPLAVELTASWAGTLSVSQIASNRRELLYAATPRDGTADRAMDSVVSHSYQLLDTDQRALLRSLAVITSWFSIEDAVGVSGRPQRDLFPGLRGLVETSWVLVEAGRLENRYRLATVLRDYVLNQLDADERRVLHARHARQFAEVAGESERGLTGPARSEWVRRMSQASSDIEAALVWAQQTPDVGFGLRISASMWWWWLTTGRLKEGRRWLAEFLGRASDLPDRVVAPALNASAALATEDGDYAAAITAAGLALRAYQALADDDGIARAATATASAQRYLGQRAEARQCFQLALDHRRRLGERRGIAGALNNLALVTLDDGSLQPARELFEEALAVKRELGDPRAIAIGLANLSDVLVKLNMMDAALTHLDEARAIAADLSDDQLVATITCNEGEVALALGQYDAAIRHFQTALSIYSAAGGPHDVVLVLINLGHAFAGRGDAAAAAMQLRRAEALSTSSAGGLRLAEIRAALADVAEPRPGAAATGLTGRQVEILVHVARGEPNKAIAKSLQISVATVERHLANIYAKLGVTGRMEAVRFALTHGLTSWTEADS